MHIVIAIAHDLCPGTRRGVQRNGVVENDWSWDFTRMVARAFVAKGHTVTVIDHNPAADMGPGAALAAETQLYDGWRPDLTLQFHLDSFPDPAKHKGIVLHGNNVESACAAQVLTAAAETAGFPMRDPLPWNAPGYGRGEAYFRGRDGARALIEVSIITSDAGLARATDPKALERLAEALASAIST